MDIFSNKNFIKRYFHAPISTGPAKNDTDCGPKPKSSDYMDKHRPIESGKKYAKVRMAWERCMETKQNQSKKETKNVKT